MLKNLFDIFSPPSESTDEQNVMTNVTEILGVTPFINQTAFENQPETTTDEIATDAEKTMNATTIAPVTEEVTTMQPTDAEKTTEVTTMSSTTTAPVTEEVTTMQQTTTETTDLEVTTSEL